MKYYEVALRLATVIIQTKNIEKSFKHHCVSMSTADWMNFGCLVEAVANKFKLTIKKTAQPTIVIRLKRLAINKSARLRLK